VLLDFLFREENRHQLIAAFADLGPHGFEGDLVPEMREGLLPGPGMKIDGIHQRSVDVEDDRLYQGTFPLPGTVPMVKRARGGGGSLSASAMERLEPLEVKTTPPGQFGRPFAGHRPCAAEFGIRTRTGRLFVDPQARKSLRQASTASAVT
jgi:hypothetical protein